MTHNFTLAKDLDRQTILKILKSGEHFKKSKSFPNLSGKILGNVFFNPSLRTRASFEAAIIRSRGNAIDISPGTSSWAFETKLGTVMNGQQPEHIKEAVQVLSRYVDALGVRSFASLKSLEEDAKEEILNSFIQYSSVPVISLESALEHPCQMMADMLTISELLGSLNKNDTICVRWAPHIKPLPLAVPHSAALAAAFSGMNVTVAIPTLDYRFEESYESKLLELTKECGRNFKYIHNPEDLDTNCKILYVKSWGAPKLYDNPNKQAEDFEKYSSWMVSDKDLKTDRYLMHCLPVRRNVVATDSALDHERSVIIQQAENRLWAQLGVLESVLGVV